MAHTIIDPWAMVIKPTNTTVALKTVSAPWRSQYLAIRTDRASIIIDQKLEYVIFISSVLFNVAWIFDGQKGIQKDTSNKAPYDYIN
jgi:hypothetical protein